MQTNILQFFGKPHKLKQRESATKTEEKSDSNVEDIPSSQDEPQSKKRKVITYSKKSRSDENYDVSEWMNEIATDIVCFSSGIVNEPTKKPKAEKKLKAEQMCIDVGQKNFGSVTCDECGMLYPTYFLTIYCSRYTPGKPEDDIVHKKFHKKMQDNVISFPGWKDETVIKRWSDGSRVIVVQSDDSPAHLKKLGQIKQLLEKELGCTGVYREQNDEKTYLFISSNKKVCGCVIAESVKQGFPIISQENDDDSAVRCSKVAKPAMCGVSRIWVYKDERRKGVATKLMDALRANFIYGMPIPKDQLAFTQPTPDGKRFFSKYIGDENFLVYT